jgi:hypothetical protein
MTKRNGTGEETPKALKKWCIREELNLKPADP